MISWHLSLFIVAVVFLIYKIWRSSNDSGGGDYSFDLETPFYYLVLIIIVVIYGGIVWW